jgi:large subunit ribosomal protein L25
VPDQITLDISDMQVGDVKRVSDLTLPEGVETSEDPETTVITVNVPQLEIEVDETTEPTEVEGEEGGTVAAEGAPESDDAPAEGDEG